MVCLVAQYWSTPFALYQLYLICSVRSNCKQQVGDFLIGLFKKIIKFLKNTKSKKYATICQLLLWAPRSWTIGIGSGHLPSSQDILQWLLTMTTKTLYECRFFNKLSAHVEYQLVATVLSRLTMANVKKSLNWIRNQNTI